MEAFGYIRRTLASLMATGVRVTKKLHEQLEAKLKVRLDILKSELGTEERRLANQAHQLKCGIDRTLGFIKSMPSTSATATDALRSSLEESTKNLREVEVRLEAVRRSGGDGLKLPTIEEFSKMVLDVEARIKADPTAAREAIRKMLEDGRLMMEPLADGTTGRGA